MDQKQAPPAETVQTDLYFGGCPEPGCGRNDGYRNIYKAHWFVCHQHRTKWCFGWNMLESWREETTADWERHAALLDGYREVAALYPAPEEEDDLEEPY